MKSLITLLIVCGALSIAPAFAQDAKPEPVPSLAGRPDADAGMIAARFTAGAQRRLIQEAIIQANDQLYYTLTMTSLASKTATGAEPAKSEAKAEGKAEVGEKAADAAAGYSRGEGQKPVSKAYKDNWNAIYGKKKKK